jgi:hypothetical protein
MIPVKTYILSKTLTIVSENRLSSIFELKLTNNYKNMSFIICNENLNQVKFAGYETAT